MGNFINVKLKVAGQNYNAKIEKGVIFENNSKAYKVDNDGNLNIFDKEKKVWTKGQTLDMTKYQYNIFKAVANNSQEKGTKANEIVLSSKDIDSAFNLYSKGKLTTDLSENLPSGYKLERPVIYKENKTLEVGVTNSVKNKKAANLFFHYGNKSILPVKTEAPAPATAKPSTPVSKTQPTETAVTNPITTSVGIKNLEIADSVLMKNPNVVKNNAFKYKVQKGENVISICQKYGLDPYTFYSANPSLKYSVKYRKNNVAILYPEALSVNSEITIPARYHVKKGSVKSFDDVAKVTGVSKEYIEQVLTANEGLRLTGYRDGGGVLTIGYGHTGKVDGKPIYLGMPLPGKTKKEQTQKALELLAEDILEHKQRTIAYLGSPYTKAPQSVQDVLLDVTFNKGIFDGFHHPNHSKELKKVKGDLERGKYATALMHTARTENSRKSAGLEKRNVYRFLHGLRDLTPLNRIYAMNNFKPYYDLALTRNKNKLIKENLRKDWNNAMSGKITIHMK